MYKKLIALLLAVLMLLSLAACGAGQEGSKEPGNKDNSGESVESSGGEMSGEADPGTENKYLRFSLQLNETLSALKPINIAGYELILQMIFGELMRYDVEKAEYVPALAEKVDISEDGLTYTVTLKDGIKFHDGEPITADDVVFTFTNAIVGSGSRCAKLAAIEGYADAQAGNTDTVAGIEKIDEKTVAFHLTQRNSVFMEALANSSFGILPKHILGDMSPVEINDYSEFWEKPVGSGAYYVSETNYPNYIVLTAFKDYYDPAGIEQILCTYYADLEARYAAAIAGELDYLPGEEEAAANNMLSKNSDLEKDIAPSAYHRWFMVNCSDTAGDQATHPSLKNARVRQAINMLIDKDAICQLMGSIAVANTSQINPKMPEYNSDLPTWKRDVEGAKKILDEENFDYDTPIRIFANYTDQQTVDFLDLVVQNLADAGVKAEYTVDSNWQPYLKTQDYDFRYAGYMSNVYTDFYSSTSVAGQTEWTKGNFPDDEAFFARMKERYDDLIDAYKASLDPVEQKRILDQIQFNAYEDMYDIPLYSLDCINIYNTAHWTGIPVYASDYVEIVVFNFSNWKLVG